MKINELEIITDNYSIYHGDCLEVMKDIPDNSISLIVTDPPYLMDYQSNRRKKEDTEE